MSIGHVVTRVSAPARHNVEKIMSSLDGCSGQEIADALLLAMVEHIEQVPKQHHAELARGISDALLANFKTAN